MKHSVEHSMEQRMASRRFLLHGRGPTLRGERRTPRARTDPRVWTPLKFPQVGTTPLALAVGTVRDFFEKGIRTPASLVQRRSRASAPPPRGARPMNVSLSSSRFFSRLSYTCIRLARLSYCSSCIVGGVCCARCPARFIFCGTGNEVRVGIVIIQLLPF